jgi:hypothetical protein
MSDEPTSLRCRMFGHEWFQIRYPPARRSQCRRCGMLAESPYRWLDTKINHMTRRSDGW